MTASKIYELPLNLAVYLLALIALIVDVSFDSNLPVIFMAIIFLAWNVGYALSDRPLEGRNPKRIDELTTIGRTYMSWYMLFFGVFFGLLLTGNPESRKSFVELCAYAGVPLWVLVSPLVLMSIAITFVPICVGKEDHTPALRALFVVVFYSEQMSIFLLLHCLVRLTLASASHGITMIV